MNEKEFNLAILNKLYEIAAAVWVKMAKNDYGTYTAKDIFKYLNKYIHWGDADKYESITISQGTYTCTFPTENLWYYITVFEKLSGIGKNARVFVHEEVGNILGECSFLLDKGASELCNFVVFDELRPIMQNVLLDVEKHCLVASDGHKLLSYPIEITECKGNMKDFLINSKQLKQMCKGMKKGAKYIVTAKKENIKYREYNKLSFNGIVSSVDYSKYPNWYKVMEEVSDYNCLTLKRGTTDAWKEIKKFVGKDKNAVVYIDGTEGKGMLKVTIGDNERNIAIGTKSLYDFKIALSGASILAAESIEKLYLGGDARHPIMAINENESIYLLMPFIVSDNYTDKVYYDNGNLNESASKYIGYSSFILCRDSWYNLVDIRTDSINNRLQYIETSKVVSNTTEQESESQSAKEVANVEPAKEVTKSVTATKATSTTKKSAGITNKEQRKFSFEKIGVKAGDVLTFVDGTEVIATADGKVEFCGEVFTLSGFTKEFIPNPTKSGAYRGCAFFYKDGVKLFKQYLATLDSEEEKDSLDSTPEEVASTTERESEKLEEVSIPDSKDDTLDSDKEYIEPWEQRFNDVWLGKAGCEIVRASAKWLLNHTIYVCVDGKARMLQVLEFRAHSDEYLVSIVGTNYSYVEDRVSFTQFYHANEITKAKYEIMKGLREPPEGYTDYTLDSTATEPQKCISVPLEVESEVITPPSEETALESQGEPPRAKVIRFDVGTLADIVSISLGVPSCKVTEPPPNMVRGAKVANRPYMWAAGNYSLTAGKVVHELPLPPPKQKRYDISQSIRYG